MNELKILLSKVEIIGLKYEKLKNENSFNIFSILRNIGDEVNLHSRFLFELLNPKGTHRKGNQFLESFLNKLEIFDFNLEDSLYLTREKWKIDLLIRNTNQAIIIENKVWANDQPEQLYRYYKKVKELGYTDIKIIYLTLDGSGPDEHSIKKLPKEFIENSLSNISYDFHINTWIEENIEKSARNPSLREGLIQYQNILNQLTGKTMANDETKELLELLSSGSYILEAFKIAKNWIHINWHTEWEFWVELENKIKTKYSLLETQKYSVDYLNSVYHKSKYRKPYYGLMAEIFKIDDDSVCIYVERGLGDLYYGITIVRDGLRKQEFQNLYPEFSKAVSEISEISNNWWMGYNHFEPRINFTSFSNDETISLISQNQRKERIEDIFLVMDDYIEEVKKIKTRD